MTKKTLALRGALLATVALLTATPAQAAPRPVITGNWLYLTVTPGDGRSTDINGTLLMCSPPRGHVRAPQACAELAAVQGDIDRIPPGNTRCPMIYAPVTASARGMWNGRRINYSHTFPNKCVLTARTGDVFTTVRTPAPAAQGPLH